MRIFFALLAMIAILPTYAEADDVDPLIGVWVSPDGYAKQSFEREFDGSWLTARLWFKADDGWKLVALGSLYRKPGDSRWFGASRASDMEGIELFESILEPAVDGSYRMTSLTYLSDGSTMETEEDWTFDGADRLSYTIYKLEDGQRSKWMGGEWLRESD